MSSSSSHHHLAPPYIIYTILQLSLRSPPTSSSLSLSVSILAQWRRWLVEAPLRYITITRFLQAIEWAIVRPKHRRHGQAAYEGHEGNEESGSEAEDEKKCTRKVDAVCIDKASEEAPIGAGSSSPCTFASQYSKVGSQWEAASQ